MQLHKLGFRLHAELAESLGIASYRRLPVLRVTPGPRTARTVDICPWLDGEYVSNSDFMDKLGGAQVRRAASCARRAPGARWPRVCAARARSAHPLSLIHI